jgi:hypothetical protein
MTSDLESPLNNVGFRSLVAECAKDSRIVSSFNAKYASELQVPVQPLQSDLWMQTGALHSSIAELPELQRFIYFVQDTVWKPSGQAK